MSILYLIHFLRIFHASFPIKKISNNNKSKGWITPAIKTQCYLKRDLYILSRNSNDIKLKNYYKSYCKLVSKNITEAKRLYYNRGITSSNNKITTTWKIINSETGRTCANEGITGMNIHGSLIENPQVISDSLNNHSLSIADKIMNKSPNRFSSNTSTNSPLEYLVNVFKTPFPNIKYNNISRQEIETIIKSLKLSNSHGYDESSVKILKVSSQFICSPLTKICNKSLLTGIFPAHRKYSEIKPLFKKGDKYTMSNCRPISLLTSFSNIFENLIPLLDSFNILIIITSWLRNNLDSDKTLLLIKLSLSY
jgi:Notch-like protein